MLIIITWRKWTFRLIISFFCGIKLLFIEVVYDFICGQTLIDYGHSQADPRGRWNLISDLIIKNDIANYSQDESEIKHIQSQVNEFSWYSRFNCWPSQQVILVNPVVQKETASWKQSSDWNQCHVEWRKPHDLKNLSVPLSNVIPWHFHYVIGFSLSVQTAFLTSILFEFSKLINWIDEPEKWNE